MVRINTKAQNKKKQQFEICETECGTSGRLVFILPTQAMKRGELKREAVELRRRRMAKGPQRINLFLVSHASIMLPTCGQSPAIKALQSKPFIYGFSVVSSCVAQSIVLVADIEFVAKKGGDGCQRLFQQD